MIPKLKINEEPGWEFLDYALGIEEEWQAVLPRLTDKELLQIFPEAKIIIPQKLSQWEQRKNDLSNIIKEKLLLIKNRVPDEFLKLFWREWIKITDGRKLLLIESNINRLKRLLWASRNRETKGRITEGQIQQALAVPIENLINQPLRRGGKTLFGLCPLHNEKHPSFHVYPATNRWWCYGGCGQGGDVIKLVRLLHDYSFREAVQYLIGI